MSSATKQRVTGSICVLCAAAMVFCIGRMIPYGMSGNTHGVKLWFIPLVIALIIGSACGVAYYFFRAKNRTVNPQDIKVHTLDQLAEQQKSKDDPHGTKGHA